jgi:hypothetical protein
MSGGTVGMRQSGISLRIALLAVIFIFSVNLADAVQKTEWPNINTQDKKLLQYRVGSHILGFAADRAYLVAMDHALSIEFLGTKGVTPKCQ